MLTINQSGANLVISWPAAAGSYQLQSNSGENNAGGWLDVSQVPAISNGTAMVTLPVSSPAQFFRLVSP